MQPIKGGVLIKTFENNLCRNHFGAYPASHTPEGVISVIKWALTPKPPLMWSSNMCTVPNLYLDPFQTPLAMFDFLFVLVALQLVWMISSVDIQDSYQYQYMAEGSNWYEYESEYSYQYR